MAKALITSKAVSAFLFGFQTRRHEKWVGRGSDPQLHKGKILRFNP